MNKNKIPAPPVGTNKLCESCRRTCKQLHFAVVSNCPRYYPYGKKSSKIRKEWKQPDLGL